MTSMCKVQPTGPRRNLRPSCANKIKLVILMTGTLEYARNLIYSTFYYILNNRIHFNVILVLFNFYF